MSRIYLHVSIFGLLVLLAVVLAVPVRAEEWSGSCDLTSACPDLIYASGQFRADGFYPNSTEGFAFYSSKDAGIEELDVAVGKLEFDIKGLDVEMIPLNSLYFGHIHRIPWNGCKDDFWFTLKKTGGEAGGQGQIWAQGFDYATKIIGPPGGGFPSGWHHVELVWNNTGWRVTIDGVGSTAGVMNFEVLPKDEEIMIGVGAEIDAGRNPVAEPDNEAGWGYGLFDILGTGVEVAYRNLEWSFGRGPVNNPNAQDSEFCTETGTSGECGCIGLNDPDIAPCSEQFKSTGGASGDPACCQGLALGWFWTLDDLLNEDKNQKEENNEPPVVNIEASPPTIVPGQTMAIVAVAEGFRTRFNNMYFGWCIKNDNTGESHSYNSVAAGGELADVDPSINVSSKAGPCCGWLTRDPEKYGDTDSDGDGMGDKWEEEKFVGRTFEGVTYENIQQVLPNDDPDADGYYANRFKNNITGEYLTVTPGLVDSTGAKHIPGNSDSLLTNVEEYILQTDPLNPDTDGDTYRDEEDYIGVGQQNITYTPDRFVGMTGYIEAIASVVGVDQRKFTYIVQGSRKLYISPLEQFRVNLLSNQELLPVGAASSETVRVNAEIETGDVDPDALVYEWTLGGEYICDEAKHPELSDYCGPGKSELILGGDGPLSFSSLPGLTDLEIGDSYPIKVDVTDAASRQHSSKEILVLRAATLDLTTNCAGSPGNDEDPSVAMEGREPLTICVGSYGVQVPNESELTFQWYKDGEFDQAQSGVGKTTYDLLGTKLPGEYHTVRLVASTGPSQAQKMSGEIRVRIAGPVVEIVEPADRIRYSDDVAREESYYIAVNPGETIEFVAAAQDFGEQTDYDWYWSAGGEEESEVGSLSGTSSFSYTVPESWADGDSTSLTVLVRGKDESGILTESSDSITLIVSPDEAQFSGGQNFFSGLAAAFSWLTPEAKMVVQVALMIIGAIAVVAIGIYLYSSFFGSAND